MGTNVPSGRSLCALAAELASPARQQIVKVTRANLKIGRFMSDPFQLSPDS
jgi:hypothetical protein